MTDSRYRGAVLFAFAAMLVIGVGVSPSHSVWDEHWYLGNVQELLAKGVSTTYLREFHVSTGPLFATIYAIPYSLSAGSVHVARVVNLLFWVLSTILVYRLQRQVTADADPAASGAWLFAPMAWPTAGLALTEGVTIPAMLGAFLIANSASAERRRLFWSAAGAGVLVGIAGVGRQLALVVAPLVLYLFWIRTRHLGGLVLLALSSAVLPLALFAVWGGPIAPGMRAVGGDSLNLFHATLAFAYLGGAIVLIDYRLLLNSGLPRATLVVGALFAVAAAAVMTENHVPAAWLSGVAGIGGTTATAGFVMRFVLWAIAMYTALALGHLVYVNRADPFIVSIAGAIMLLCFAASSVASQFSSRYVVVAIPFLVLLRPSSRRLPSPLLVRVGNVIGASIGMVLLWRYYRGG